MCVCVGITFTFSTIVFNLRLDVSKRKYDAVTRTLKNQSENITDCIQPTTCECRVERNLLLYVPTTERATTTKLWTNPFAKKICQIGLNEYVKTENQ